MSTPHPNSPPGWPRRRPIAPVVVLAIVVGALIVGSPARATLTDGLVVRYSLDQTTGSVARDVSGHGRDATVVGDATWLGTDGIRLGGTNGHLAMPDDLMRGLTEITVSTEVNIAPDQATPYFIWGLGNTSNGAGDGYLFTTGNGYRTSIASGNWSTEQTVTAGRALSRDRWRTITYTLADGTAVIFEDGVEVARTSSVTSTPGSIGGGSTSANYIGRSLYSSDRYLKGKIRDFRVYDRALSADEVRDLGPTAAERVARDSADLNLGDTGAVTADLRLPSTGPNGSTYTWNSDDESVVSPDGAVTRPPHGSGDATVTLTATVSFDDVSDTVRFEVTVLEDLSQQQKVEEAAAALLVHDASAIRGNITLPTTGLHGTSVEWRSSEPSVITPAGEVSRPAPGEEQVRLNVHARVRLGKTFTQRRFRLTVLPLPAPAANEGYMFTYFTGEGTATGEQVYFAASRGNDPLHWSELNGGQPVLTSSLGDEGVRDPFIIRSPEGDKFFLIATDLKIHGNGNWDQVQRHGSKYIEVWESTDLVNWSDQRHVKVAPETAGNTWAPEAFYDESIGAYVVFWASKLYEENDPEHTGNTYNRMMYATTRDFRTFSAPKVWVDPGYSVIDSTVIKDGDGYYRFTKDERNNSSTTPCSKFILEERSMTLRDTDWDFVSECIGKATPGNPGIARGEGPTIFRSNTEVKWYLFIDEFGGRGYVPFESTDLDEGTFVMSSDYDLPDHPRHGTVLPVTTAELERLRGAFQPVS